MHCIDDTEKVHIEGVDETGGRHVFAERTDTGVRHDDMQSAQLPYRLGKCCFESGAITDVDTRRHHLLPGLFHQSSRFLQIGWTGEWVFVAGDVCAQIEGDDVRALLRETDGVTAPLTSSSAGHQHHFSVNSVHFDLSPVAVKTWL